MTLEELKESFKSIILSHRQLNSFDYGEDFLLATGKGTDYPLGFLEIPYSSNYDITSNKFKTFQFALLILFQPTNDDLNNDHKAISKAEAIGDSVIQRIQSSRPELKLDSVTGISLREFSDDNVSGFRFDITARTFRECLVEEDFN